MRNAKFEGIAEDLIAPVDLWVVCALVGLFSPLDDIWCLIAGLVCRGTGAHIHALYPDIVLEAIVSNSASCLRLLPLHIRLIGNPCCP